MTIGEVRRWDTEGMYEAIRAFPEQLADGRMRAIAQKASVGGLLERPLQSVLVAGMGGSAIAGDLLRALAEDHARIPVAVSRSYRLPTWVNEHTLVIASSYSGNTEETLSAFAEAEQRGAHRMAITTGGFLKEQAVASDVPVVDLVPGLQPRAALSYSAAALITCGQWLGLHAVRDADWQEAVAITGSQRTQWQDPDDKDNWAANLAATLQPLLPVIYSSIHLEVANVRWRNQIHENSKSFAVGNLLPEMNHNEVMGWARFGNELSRLGVVVLRDVEEHPRTRQRLDITRALIRHAAGHWEEVTSTGTSRMARILSLMYMSDWVSFYLAIRHRIDPSPVELISTLKARLVES